MEHHGQEPLQAEVPTTEASQMINKVWSCVLCNVIATCPQNLIMHLEGKKHEAKVEALKSEVSTTQTSQLTKKDWSCDLCNVTVLFAQNLIMHLEGKKHKAKVEALKCKHTVSKTCGSNAKPEPIPAVVGQKKAEPETASKIINIQVNEKMTDFWCPSCKLKCNSAVDMASHPEGKNHKAKMMVLEKYKSTFDAGNPSGGKEVVEKVFAEDDKEYRALLAGLFANRGVGGFGFMPPFFPMSSIQREIERERLQEEVLREMQERQTLKEEVRRDIERMMSMRRAQIDFIHDHSVIKPHISEFMIREGYWPSQGRTVAGAPMIGIQARSNPPRVDVDKKSHVSSSDEVLQAKEGILGTKKKAEASTKQTAKLTEKDWSCGLCQIIATSEHDLKMHINGMKHKAKVQELKGYETVTKTRGSNAKPKPNPPVVSKKNAEPKVAPKIMNIQADGKMHKVLQENTHLWCLICHLKCYSTFDMASHLGGKKHNAKMMELEKDKTS